MTSMHAEALEPEAGLLLRLRRSDSSSPSAQREFPRSPATAPDELEGSARLEIGLRGEPRDDIQIRLSVMSVARWGSVDDAIFEAGETGVKIENIAMLPLSIAAGRQTISWGRGLLFSDQDKDHLFDMANVSWDTLPHRFDLLHADPALTVLDSPVNHLWLARWFYQAKARSSVELFGGAMSLEEDGGAALAGLRGVWASGPLWETWIEMAGEAVVQKVKSARPGPGPRAVKMTFILLSRCSTVNTGDGSMIRRSAASTSSRHPWRAK